MKDIEKLDTILRSSFLRALAGGLREYVPHFRKRFVRRLRFGPWET